MSLELAILLISILAFSLLYIKRFATPLPVANEQFLVMAERIAVLENKLEKVQIELMAYKARYGELSRPASDMSIQELLKVGRIEDALNALEKSIHPDSLDSVILLHGQYKRAKALMHKQIIERAQYERTLTQISSALLDLAKNG